MIYYTSVRGKGGFYVGKCEKLRSRWELTCAHTHSYWHTHSHTPTHIHLHTHTHILAHATHKHTCTHIHTHPYTQTCSQTHTYIHTHTHIHTYPYTQTHPHSQTHTYIHTYIPIHTDTPTLTYIHTLLHSHTHTQWVWKAKALKHREWGDYFISPRSYVGSCSGEKLPAWAWLQEVMEHRGVRWAIHHCYLPHTTHRPKIWHQFTGEQTI